MMKKKLFITGANGQIGSYIIKKLKKNYQIFGFDKDFNFNDIKSLNKIMKKNFYAVIFAHGYNTTPKKKSKKSKLIDESEIMNFLETNFLLNCRIINSYIQNSNQGRVINLSSIYSIKSPKHFIYKNFNKEVGYSASKAASNIMMKYMGTKLGKKFLFNSIILGGVKNNNLDNYFIKNYKKNNPLGKMMELNEIMPVIDFLLEKNNTHTNAQNIHIDGGWLSW